MTMDAGQYSGQYPNEQERDYTPPPPPPPGSPGFPGSPGGSGYLPPGAGGYPPAQGDAASPAPPPSAPYGYGYDTGHGYGAYLPQHPAPAGRQGLLQKWIAVTMHPSVASFWNELPTANWRDILLSLLGLGVLEAITSSLAALYMPDVIDIPRANGTFTRVRLPAGIHWSSIFTVPIAFFIVVGILFLVARLLGGRGTMLELSYASSLSYVPLQGLSALVGLIPFLGGIVAFALGIYQLVLTVFAIAASQRLTLGRATMTVLLPAFAAFFLACLLAAAFAAVLAGTLRGS